MKKILFTGVSADVTEARVREKLEAMGPVHEVLIIRDGNPEQPYVVVMMDISDGLAQFIATRVTDYWHEGRVINARLLHH